MLITSFDVIGKIYFHMRLNSNAGIQKTNNSVWHINESYIIFLCALESTRHVYILLSMNDKTFY